MGQIWKKQHKLIECVSGNNDLKKNGLGVSATPNYGSAFLGPNLWERPNDDNNDIDFEYMDLDEFLTENGIPVDLDVEGEQVNCFTNLSLTVKAPIRAAADNIHKYFFHCFSEKI